MKNIILKIKKWWKKHICDTVPKGYESMFDEYFEKDEDGNIKRY
jgi:hypothetical protein